MAAAVPAPGGGAQAPDPDLLGGPMWGSEAGERQLLAAERRASATGIMDAGPLVGGPGRQVALAAPPCWLGWCIRRRSMRCAAMGGGSGHSLTPAPLVL